MTPKSATMLTDKERREKRERLGQVRVLLADRDIRTASLVQKILFSFGFRKIDMVLNGESALEHLRSKPYDLIVTEWNMTPTSGIELVREIRSAREDKRIRRDIPILMLTAKSEQENVEEARDAGITEFIAKPFTAKTISNRIIQIIDNPRAFIESPGYTGPCRRRREKLAEGMVDRRLPPELRRVLEHQKAPSFILPANDALREQLGAGSITAIITEDVIDRAQKVLLTSEKEFVAWARDDIATLESAYAQLKASKGDISAHKALLEAAYSIKSQAGIFGYELGTRIGGMLVNYLGKHVVLNDAQLLVVRKHIDVITVIFTQQIKENGQAIGEEMITSLTALMKKIG